MSADLVIDAGNEAALAKASIADATTRRLLVRKLDAGLFQVPAYAALWRALRAMVDQGLEYDRETVRRLLRAEGSDEDACALDALEDSALVPENLDWHVATLNFDAARAHVARVSLPAFIEQLRDPKGTPADLAASALAMQRAVASSAERGGVKRPLDVARGYRAELARRCAAQQFWATGIDAVDTHLSLGAAPGKTWCIVGLSSSGKSAFVLGKLVLSLVRRRRRVALCAWEINTNPALDVMCSAATGVPLTNILRGTLTDEERASVETVSDYLARHVRFVEKKFWRTIAAAKDARRPSNDRQLDLLEGYMAELDCDVWVYDLWERILVDLSYEGVTRALYRMQELHQDYDVCGAIVQQILLKDVEKRRDKRPTRDGIKGTGAYVEVPDVLLGVHREAQFKQVPNDSMEVICMKQRDGDAPWAVRFGWDGARVAITGGEDVEYDPGLDSADLGDIASIKVGGKGGGGGRSGRPRGRDS